MSEEMIYCKCCGVPLCVKEESYNVVKIIKCNCCGFSYNIKEETHKIIDIESEDTL